MDTFIAQLLNGISIGSIYALLVTGFNLMFVVCGIFHFAYSYIVILCMYVTWMVLKATGKGVVMSGIVALAIPSTIFAGIGLNLLTEPLFRPLTKKRAQISTLILGLGLSIIIADILNRHIYGGSAISFPSILMSDSTVIHFGLASLTVGQTATILGGIGAVFCFLYILYKTKLGRSFRAIAQSRFAARLLGIPINRISIFGYIIAGLLAGISAVFLVMYLGAASDDVAGTLALKVIAISFFAGLGNLKGGLICGIILGIIESFLISYLPGLWYNAFAYGVIMITVILKPEGLFGRRF